MKYVYRLMQLRSVWFLLVPFLLTTLLLFVYYGKAESHLIVNRWNSGTGDLIFKYLTYLGDGILFAFLILIFLFIRIKSALFLLTASLLTLITVFVTKKIIFNGIPRPYKYFEGTDVLHLVDGVKMHSMNSFPSGHTITAFAIFMIVAFVIKNRYLQTLFVMMAILAGFSRVYLSQHFMIDVFFGAIIGTGIAVLSCVFIDNLGICQGSWTEKSLIQIFDKKK